MKNAKLFFYLPKRTKQMNNEEEQERNSSLTKRRYLDEEQGRGIRMATLIYYA